MQTKINNELKILNKNSEHVRGLGYVRFTPLNAHNNLSTNFARLEIAICSATEYLNRIKIGPVRVTNHSTVPLQ